ncbi:TPA: hypothetical protein ACH3X1_013570 [Trebouxia sp. C0004]
MEICSLYSYTYGGLLFIQVRSDPAQVECSSVQGKMQSPLFSVALQNRLSAGSLSLQLHLWRFAHYTGVQGPSTNALQQGSGQNAISTVQCCSVNHAHNRQCVTAGQNAISTVQCCSAKQALRRQFVTAVAPMEICSLYSYTYGGLLFIQVRSDPAQVECSSVQGKMQSPLFSVALQNRLSAGSLSLQLHLWRFAHYTGVQGPSTNALQQGSGQNASSTLQCCSAKQAHSRQCFIAVTPMEVHPCKFALHIGVQGPSTNALQQGSGQNASSTVQCCSVNHAHNRQCVTAGVQGPSTNALQQGSGQNASSTLQCCSAKQAHSRQCFIAVTPMEVHLCKFALHTGVQGPSTNALQQGSGQNAISTVQCCSVNHAHNRQCVTAGQNAISTVQCCSAKQALRRQFVTAVAPMEICSLYSYTYGGLLFIQVRSDPAQVECSSVQGKMQSPLFSVALQNRLSAGSLSLQLHLWRFAHYTGVQGPSTNALQQGSGQNASSTLQCCSAKQALSRQFVTAVAPMEICSLYRYTYANLLFIQVCRDPPQMLCSTVQGKMQSPLFSVALQNRLSAGSLSLQLHLWRFAHCTGSQQAVFHCSYTYGGLLFIQVRSDPAQVECSSVQGKMQSPLCTYGDLLIIQVCSDPAPLLCSRVQGKMQSPLFSAALYTYANLLFIQVCRDPPQMLCSTVQGKMQSPLCTYGDLLIVQVCRDPAPMLCSRVQGKMQSPLFSAALYTYANLLFIQVCRDPPQMLCSTVQGKTQSPLFSVALQNRLSAGSLSLQLHLWRFAHCTGSQQAVFHCSYTYGGLLFIQVRSDPAQVECSSVQGKMQSPLCTYGDLLIVQVCRDPAPMLCSRVQGKMQSPLCTYGDLLIIQVCSDPAPMLCSRVQGKMQSPLFSAALYTYANLLFIQVCRDPPQMLCSTVQGKMQSPLFSVALQNRLSAGSLSLQLHLWRFAHCTGSQQAVFHCSYTYGGLLFIQVRSDPAQVECSSVQGKMQSPLFSAALQNSYTYGGLLFIQVRSDPAQVECSSVQGNLQAPLFSVALQNRLSAGLYHCKYTYEGLLFIQVCSDPTPVHCNTVQGKMQSPLISPADYNWLASGLYHCKYTYEDLLFIQVRSDPAQVECSSVQGNLQAPLFSVALQNRLSAGSQQVVCLYSYTYANLLFIQVCRDQPQMLCSSVQGKMQSPLCTYANLLFIQVCRDPAPMLCSRVQGKMQSPLFSAALYTYANLLFIQVCRDPPQMLCSTVQGKMQSPLCTYGDLLIVQVCRDPAPMLCSRVQGKMQSPLFSVALYTYANLLFIQVCRDPPQMLCSTVQGKMQSPLCTYGDLLIVQVCRDPAPMLCSRVQGKMQAPLFSVALQNRLTAGSVSLQLHLWRFALHTGSQQAVCHCSCTYGDLLIIQVCSDPAPMLCSRVQGKMQSPLFSAALYTYANLLFIQAVCHCSCTYGDLLIVQVCRDPAPMLCSRVQGKMQSPLFSAALYTYANLLFIQVCRDPPQMLCSTVQGKMQSPLFSVALQNRLSAGSLSLQLHLWRFAHCTGSQQAVFHCSYTYGGLLFIQVRSDPAQVECSSVQGKMQSPLCTYGDLLIIQVCSDPAPMLCSRVQGKMQSPLFSAALDPPQMLCSTVQGKMQSPLFSVALQNRLSAGSLSLQLHLWRFAHCTGSQQAVCHCSCTYGDLLIIQVCSDPAPMLCSRVQGKMQSPLFSAALDPPQMLCSTVQGKMQSPLFSVALQNRLSAGSLSLQLHLWRFAHCTGSQQAVCHCSCTYGDLLIIQVCSDPAPMLCSRVQGKMQSPLFSAALYTYANLLFIQVCRDPPQMLCSTVQGKMQSPLFSVALQNSYTYGGLLFIQVRSDPAQVECSSVQGKMQSPLFSVALQNRLSAGSLSLQLHLWRFAHYTGVQGPSTNALQQGSGQNASSTLQCCSAKQALSRQFVTAVAPMEICSLYSYTYGGLLFIQVRSDPAQVECSSVQGKMQSPLFSVALQNRLSAGSLSLQLHLWRFAHYTGVQ